MIASEGTLSSEKIEEVRAKLESYLDTTGLSLAEAAPQIGYSATVLSTFINKSYKGDSSRVARASNLWMERHARNRAARRKGEYIKMRVVERMRAIITNAIALVMMAAICAPSGTGKTMLLQILARQFNAIIITASRGMTFREMLHAIAKQLGWLNEKARRADLLEFVVTELQKSKRPIFIDEAHLLGRVVTDMRCIHDQAQVSIVFVGAAEIMHLASDRSHGHGQFSSRTVPYNALENIADVETPDGGKEGRSLYTLQEIQAYLDSRKIRFDRDGLRLCWAISCLTNFGAMRLLQNLLDFTLQCEQDAVTLTRQDLLDAMPLVLGANVTQVTALATAQLQRFAPTTAAVAKAG